MLQRALLGAWIRVRQAHGRAYGYGEGKQDGCGKAMQVLKRGGGRVASGHTIAMQAVEAYGLRAMDVDACDGLASRPVAAMTAETG